MPTKIEISHKTIIFTVVVVLSLGLIYLLKDLLLELFVALLLMVTINPMIVWLSKYKVPRVVSVLISYLFIIGTLTGVVSILLPAIIDQTTGFVETFPTYLYSIGITSALSSDFFSGLINTNLGNAPEAIFQLTFSIVNNVIGILSVLVFAFYMLISRDKIEYQLGSFFGDEKRKEVAHIIDSLEKRLGGWARGELLLMVSIGLATFIGLSLLGIPFALPLAVLSGLLEIIPVLGPIISAIPAILIGFGISPITGMGVAALSFLIQQLENYVLVPKIMEKSAGVSPLTTLIALAVGARLAGVVGAIISVPVLITLQILTKKYLVKEN